MARSCHDADRGPRVIATSWTRDKAQAFAFPSLQAARNMVDALGGDQFKIQKL